jgi:endonuclease/exonuclease/phosphatase (EEP) superfamily protein YafD
VVATHPVPPVSAAWAQRRNDHIGALAAWVAGRDGPVVVAGDLNTTAHSPVFRALLATARLRDSRRGAGIQPSWPSHLRPLGIAIDHILTSPAVLVHRRGLGLDVGSDHLPMWVEISLHL